MSEPEPIESAPSSGGTAARPVARPVATRRRAGTLRRMLGDIAYVAKREKKVWMLPLILVLLLLAALLAFATLAGPLAPFVYPLL